jgi:DNA invertase Pin-like site-specific DNA recombinase
MFAAIKAMMFDMLAAMARKDYDDRRRRQAEGISRAKAAGLRVPVDRDHRFRSIVITQSG